MLSAAELEPVASRATVADQVYNQLRHALITGGFEPGQMLTISALSERLGTSHMPVREALRRLGAEGALEVRANGSAYVPQVSRRKLDDICRARIALETLATRIAVAEITDEEIAALERLEAEHVATAHLHDASQMLMKNMEFHFSIYRASRSEVLLPLIGSLWLQYGPYMRMLSSEIEPELEGKHEPFMRGHHALVDALRRRDADLACREMEADIQRTQALLQDLCAD